MAGGIRQIRGDVIERDILERLERNGYGNIVAVNQRDIVVGVAVSSIECKLSKRNRYVAL